MKKVTEIFCRKMALGMVSFLFAGLIPAISLLKMEVHSENITQKFNIKFSDEKNAELSLDELLCGALAAEMPISFEPEALKAQVVAIHTYFLKQNQGVFEVSSVPPNGKNQQFIKHLAFMRLEDRKAKWGNDFLKNELKLRLIVSSVKNKVLFFENDLALTYFFSWCYKKTTPCKYGFSQDIPYLKSVDSPEYESKMFPKLKTTELKIKKLEMKEKLKSKFDNKEFSDKLNSTHSSEWIKVSESLDNGYVTELSILGEKMEGKSFRQLIGLQSSNFSILYNSKEEMFKIKCIGWGHGVGMSQFGANCYAKQGMKYQDILSHYYPGTELRDA